MRIERNHELGKETARGCVDKMRSDVEAKYGLSTVWEGDDLKVSGNGVSGTICVDEQQVIVDLRLGFALMMLEGPIKAQLSEAMDKYLVE